MPSNRAMAGRALELRIIDPDKIEAMANAVARVLAGEINARVAAFADPRMSMKTLHHKVH